MLEKQVHIVVEAVSNNGQPLGKPLMEHKAIGTFTIPVATYLPYVVSLAYGISLVCTLEHHARTPRSNTHSNTNLRTQVHGSYIGSESPRISCESIAEPGGFRGVAFRDGTSEVDG